MTELSLVAAREKDEEINIQLAEAEKINEEEMKEIQDGIDQVDKEIEEVKYFEDNKEVIENKLIAEGLELERKLKQLCVNGNDLDDTNLTDTYVHCYSHAEFLGIHIISFLIFMIFF